MPLKRKIKVRNLSSVKQARLNNGERMAGGLPVTIGYTADMNELTVIEKDLYGMFGDKRVIEGDIMAGGYERAIVEPVFPYRDLMKIYLQSTILRQCVEAYRVNIDGYGHTLEYIGPEGQQDSLAARNEYTRLNRVLDNLCTDGRPLQQHREDARTDNEVFGAKAFEISEDMIGRTVIFNHVPVHTLRMTKRDKETTSVVLVNPVTGGDFIVQRRFRRFIQRVDGRNIWFKEYGDPRPINPKDGTVDYSLAIEDRATAIYYKGLYTPGTPYGTPRWVGAIPSLLGAREAEMVNLNFFRDNAIPAMAVLVSGGALTEESFNKIEQYIAGVRGQKSMNRIVVLEATTEGTETAAIDGSMPAPKVDIKPMLSERQHEGLFGNYIAASEEKARSSFRLPPIYTGVAKDYNRASAFASMLTADQQIFIPERQEWDMMFDRIVMSTHNPKFWRVKSIGPTLSDPQEVSRIVTTLSQEGGLTPNVAIKLANRYLDADIEPIMEDWGDYPFAIVLQAIKAGDKVKGFESFIEQIGQTAQANPPTDAGTSPQTTLKHGVAQLFDDLSENLRRDVETILNRAIIDYSGNN